MASVTQNPPGTDFIDASPSAPMAASAANAPLLLLDDLEMGSATVGGHPSSFANQARAAVAIAKQILDGKAFDRVPVVSTRNSNVFDWPALKRWGFQETTAGSVAADRQSTAWQAYKGYILSAIFCSSFRLSWLFLFSWNKSAEET